jgi:hypothetical protein
MVAAVRCEVNRQASRDVTVVTELRGARLIGAKVYLAFTAKGRERQTGYYVPAEAAVLYDDLKRLLIRQSSVLLAIDGVECARSPRSAWTKLLGSAFERLNGTGEDW